MLLLNTSGLWVLLSTNSESRFSILLFSTPLDRKQKDSTIRRLRSSINYVYIQYRDSRMLNTKQRNFVVTLLPRVTNSLIFFPLQCHVNHSFFAHTVLFFWNIHRQAQFFSHNTVHHKESIDKGATLQNWTKLLFLFE